MRDNASIVPYKQFIGLRQIFTLLCGGVRAPPYHLFYCWLPTIKYSVGNGPNLSESPQTMHPKTEIWRTPGTVKTVSYKSFFNLRPFL